MYNIPAIIFAGGKSTRMGKDKALLPFENFTTLSAFQHNRLNQIFSKVYLSAKKNKFDFPCQVIKDIYKESSPLVGLLSCFDVLETDTLFILSVDAPLVDKEVIEKLYKTSQLQEYRDKDTIIAKSPKGVQPLCGIYKRSIIPLAKEHFLKNNHKLTDLLSASHTHYVSFDEEKAFTNLNTPQEYTSLLSS